MEQYLIYNTLNYPILSTVVGLPLFGSFLALFLRGDRVIKIWGMLITTATALLSIPLYTAFDLTTAKFQFAELSRWIPFVDIQYVLGVDGISVLLVLLTTLVMPTCILCSWSYIKDRLKEFIFVILLMEAAMIGVFVSLNTVLFFIFWEAMLVPMYLIIAVWGGPRKDYASIKFFLYTLIGSIFLLVGIIALYVTTGTFFIPELMTHHYSFSYQMWLFLGFTLAFAIKIPMWPLHTWLPAAHVEAPTAGSVILASILLKMGGYGFLRFCLPITPAATWYFMPYLILFSIISIIFGGYLALGQEDVKRLIAYSSVGHMGFVTLGIFLLNDAGIKGAILQMVNHGVTTGALFICVGIIYERTHSRMLSDNTALGMWMPIYVTFLVIFALSSLAFPGTNSFVGEFLVLMASFSKYKIVGALAVIGAILAAAYMLRMVQKMVWADSDGHKHGERPQLFDMVHRETAMLAFLTIFVFLIGLHPKPFLDVMDTSTTHLIQQLNAGLHNVPSGHHAHLDWLGQSVKNLLALK